MATKAADRCLDCGQTEFDERGDRNPCTMPANDPVFWGTMRVFHRFDGVAAAIRSMGDE
jgi:hypothetical protein